MARNRTIIRDRQEIIMPGHADNAARQSNQRRLHTRVTEKTQPASGCCHCHPALAKSDGCEEMSEQTWSRAEIWASTFYFLCGWHIGRPLGIGRPGVEGAIEDIDLIALLAALGSQKHAMVAKSAHGEVVDIGDAEVPVCQLVRKLDFDPTVRIAANAAEQCPCCGVVFW